MDKEESAGFRREILDSWERCLDYGLDQEQEPHASDAAFLVQPERSETELMAVTEMEVLPNQSEVFSSSRCLVVLADRNATVLGSWGSGRMADRKLKPRFQRGTNWQERVTGTNSIGTAVDTSAPIQVQRTEHFLKANRRLVGSAAPIFDANKALAGVLSVFSDAYLPEAHTLGAVRLLSQSVENRLIRRQFEGVCFLITLNTTADNFDSPWSGLLVCDETGRVISSNQRADQLLGVQTFQVALDALFTSSCDGILGQPADVPIQLVTRSRVRLSARIKRPGSSPVDTEAVASGGGQPRQLADNEGELRLEYGDPAVRRSFDQASKVLERGVPVLIGGETGVGKEVMVKALHHASHRRDQPLISVNCAAIPPELVESELFGYESGAFTGARSQGALGFIRKADKGILFLDEIGEMPVSAQSRLLRVLQEREVTPVGATYNVPVDLLLVTASNRNLASQIEAGRFRADLYYRVNGLNVELPALRKRMDKRELIQRLYWQYREPGQAMTLCPEVLATLEHHPWPGNIRQLVNVLKVAIAIADGDDVRGWHLPTEFLAGLEQQAQNDPSPAGMAHEAARETAADEAGLDWGRKEWGMDGTGRILDLYQRSKGNVSRTARELGISRNTLYKRLRELGVR
ncbi:sigma-54-dependent Fis family transcriptional regulator [Halomonadaceae bacterium KBTZ08]